MNKISAPVLALAIIILSVKFTVSFKPLYYYDINHLNISNYTNLNKNEIKSAYDYLIYYVNSNHAADFKIPGLPSSPEGIIHFQEVRNIFIKLNYILYICAAISILGIFNAFKKRNFRVLKWASWLSIIFAIGAAVPFAINFNMSFTMFHKLFFSNNYWIFDPLKDPVINILPEEFFFHCAILILVLILTASAVLMFVYKNLSGKLTSPSQPRT